MGEAAESDAGYSTGVVLYAMLPRDGGPRRACARRACAIRSRFRRHSWTHLESLRAARIRAAEDRLRRPLSISRCGGILCARVPAGRCRSLGSARAARRHPRQWRRWNRVARIPRQRRSPFSPAIRVVVARPVPSVVAMRLLTYTFVGLVMPLAVVTRGQPGARRALWMAVLAIFAVSRSTSRQFHPATTLADRARRTPRIAATRAGDALPGLSVCVGGIFSSNARSRWSALVTIAFMAIVAWRVWSSRHPTSLVIIDPCRGRHAIVTLWVATALLYPLAPTSHRVVRRCDRAASTRLPIHWRAGRPICPDPRGDRAAPATDVCAPPRPPLDTKRSIGGRPSTAEPIRSVLGSSYRACTRQSPDHRRRRRHGTRWWSTRSPADAGCCRTISSMLETIAIVVARRNSSRRSEPDGKSATIRAARAGDHAAGDPGGATRAASAINPHFLFNALTTIGYLIQTAPPRALDTLMRLTSLLRGVLRSDGEFTTLGREIDVIEAYLDIERARFEQRLRVRIDVPARLRDIRVPVLVLQPLVENAVKHGISARQAGGRVTVRAAVEDVRQRHALVARRARYWRGCDRSERAAWTRGGRRAAECRAPAGLSVRRRGLVVD